MNMSFYIEKIILWTADGKQRVLKFKNDKVNVITGNSKTGKTAILEIIDYCLCGSESNISYEHIGENVLWYGLHFYINGKVYTIARGRFKDETTFSSDYYFSPIGHIPDIPEVTIDESELKTIIEQEFSINSNVTFRDGGNQLKKNSKISYRYFLLFNTLSGDVIDHSKNYFDKMDLDRYREALPRIFDLALGITTIDNILVQDKISAIERNISKIEKDKERILQEIENKIISQKVIIKKAKEAKILTPNIVDFEESIKQLKYIFETGNLSLVEFEQDKVIEKLKEKKQRLEIEMTKLKRFKKRYSLYKKHLEKEKNALKPIKYINKTFSNNITNDEYRQFLNILEEELGNIKKAIRTKLPFEYGVDDKIAELENKLSGIENQLKITPDTNDTVMSDKERLISIGELKAEFAHLDKKVSSPEKLDERIKLKQKELKKLLDSYVSTEERKKTMIEALNDYIQTYIEVSKDALDEYGEYLATFDYSRKVLKLRKNKATTTANITSSSDHLFMHLCLFLGMHQLIMDNNVPYVLPFIIIDQPSRPYFNNNTFDYNKSKENISKKDDWNKVKEIFNLFDIYFDNILKDEHHFQIILLEHVATDAWKNCRNIHLVEIFDGEENALIPPPDESDKEVDK
jgi:DNA repair exonuclease SbcCD ATPase subunit